MTHVHGITVLVFSLILGYFVAAEFGIDLFQLILSVALRLLFEPIMLFFHTFAPLMQKAFRKKRFIPVLRVWNFSLDCVIAAMESLVSGLQALGM